MKRNKCKLLIVVCVVAISISSFGLSRRNVSKASSKPDAVNTNKKAGLTISKAELDVVAEKIFKNEAGGKKEELVYWNSGEDFPSLGIGHFIWYKQGQKGLFEESFPPLVEYYKARNVKLPRIMEKNKYSPWQSRDELFRLKNSGNKDVAELTDFLYNTKDIQVSFIFERLENSLEKMLEIADNPENVKKQFYRVANSPNGLYPLIDYVNFKGEGTNPKERYNDQGWGLLQVLENMKGTEIGKAALTEFSNSAKFVLQRRVNNSDPSKNEKKWLQGWFNRCNTYAE